LPFTSWPGAWLWIVIPAKPFPSTKLSFTTLQYDAVPGNGAAIRMPAPPPLPGAMAFPIETLSMTVLL
jgi:hypothetical protein